MVREQEIKQLINQLRSGYNIIETKLAPDGGNTAKAFTSFLPGAGTLIFADAVNNIRPVGSTINSAIRELERLLQEMKDLENDRDRWKDKYNDLREGYEEYKRKYETEKQERLSEQLNNVQIKERLGQQLLNANSNNSDLKRSLTASENEVKNLQTLRLEDAGKVGELKVKDEEINILKKNLVSAKNDTLDERLSFKEYKLEIFVNRLEVGLRKVQNLRRNYKELITIRENNNISIVTENNILESITLIQENLQEEEIVSISNVQKLCRKCEKLAKLELEIEKLRQQQQQYQSHQEVPTI
jgi:chromosome segregation ATPase